MLTGNKGEWSEVYTLLKVISDKNLYAGDEDLEKVKGLFYPIIKVLRDESLGTFEFSYDSELVIISSGDDQTRIPISEFHNQSKFLLAILKESTSRTFSVPEIEEFINSFNCTSLKAKSSVKSDIRIVIHDQMIGSSTELGFSIKSQLGNPSTLLNPGRTTNFIFSVSGVSLSSSEVQEINSVTTRQKVKERLSKLEKYEGSLQFETTENSTFFNNMTLIDSALPEILARIVIDFYTSSLTKLSDLVAKLSYDNPLKFDDQTGHPFYEYKIKRFLTDVALGMTPATVWTGQLDSTGGYLVVKGDGEILCYHIYNRNEFEDYLLKNTKLDTASTSKFDFGTVYTESGNQKIKLNLQVRFLK